MKIVFEETVLECVEWTVLAEDRDRVRTLKITIMGIKIP
jgi:hypothetical protein